MAHMLLTLNEPLLQRSKARGPLGLSLTTKQIKDCRQNQTDRSSKCENSKCVNYDYKVNAKILIKKGWFPLQSRVHMEKTTMDFNYQQFIQMKLSGFKMELNQKNQYLESITIQ
jgi:hypothetical protein